MRVRHNHEKTEAKTLLEEYQLSLKGGRQFIAKDYIAWLETRCLSLVDQVDANGELLRMETNRRTNTEAYLNGRLLTVAERTQALIDHLKAYAGFTGDEAILQDLVVALPVKPGERIEEEPEIAEA